MVDTPATTTTTTSTTSSNGSNAKKYEGDGLVFRAKLIGMEDLSIDRDEKICLDSMFKLKAVVRARGEHKQRVQLNLTMSAVKVYDEATKAQIASHEIERISFVVIDPRDTRAFGYIYNTTDDRHQFWAIKTERAAAVTVLALKELFELAFEQFTNTEKAKQVNQTTVPSSPTPSAPVTSPVQTPPVQAPPPQQQTSPVSTQQPDMFAFPAAAVAAPPPPTSTVTPAPETTTASLIDGDIWGDNPSSVTQAKQPSSDDIFGFGDTSTTVTHPPQQQQAAPAMDPLADLFSSVPSTTQPQIPTGASNPLFGVFSTNTPTSTPPPVNPYNNFYSQPPQQNIFNPTPMTFNQAQPMAFTPMPPQQQQQPQANLLNPNPISPVAPPTVTSPFAGLDIFGGLPSSSTTTAKTTRDAFFPTQSTAKTIQQMQMEKQS